MNYFRSFIIIELNMVKSICTSENNIMNYFDYGCMKHFQFLLENLEFYVGNILI